MPLPSDVTNLLSQLREIVGSRNVLCGDRKARRFTQGYRYGGGTVCAVVRPGTLLEQWRAFKASIEAGLIVIMQGANTGLNGGSTPFGDGYDRDIILINTMRIGRIDLLGDGRQVLCLSGATLNALEQQIRPLGREPHSVIGSTTIGASVVGGVCNNSGGALLRHGPAYTQMALYGQVNADGSVSLHNHLGIALGETSEEILERLDKGHYDDADIDWQSGRLASDPHYSTLIRDIDSSLPARYNHDPRLLDEASGSAGKLCVFAVRLDTFASTGPSKVFYIGSNDHKELTKLRRHILSRFTNLPVAGEYLNRDAYRLAETYAKDLYLFLQYFGTSRLSRAFVLKSRFDAFTRRFGLGTNLSDRLLNAAMQLLPSHLPARMNRYRDDYEHHLLLRMDGAGIDEARDYLASVMPSKTGAYFECDEREAAAAYRHRYAVGGASVRFRAVHEDTVENIAALDLAFPRNAHDWRDQLPPELDDQVVGRVRCGHFFCHVFHYDYIIRKGADWLGVEQTILNHLAGSGIEFPSEHNVGHLYAARPVLTDFYRSLDPTNSLNPGIGQTSKRRDWH